MNRFGKGKKARIMARSNAHNDVTMYKIERYIVLDAVMVIARAVGKNMVFVTLKTKK